MVPESATSARIVYFFFFSIRNFTKRSISLRMKQRIETSEEIGAECSWLSTVTPVVRMAPRFSHAYFCNVFLGAFYVKQEPPLSNVDSTGRPVQIRVMHSNDRPAVYFSIVHKSKLDLRPSKHWPTFGLTKSHRGDFIIPLSRCREFR